MSDDDGGDQEKMRPRLRRWALRMKIAVNWEDEDAEDLNEDCAEDKDEADEDE